MFEIIMHSLETIQKDEKVADVLNTIGATALSLADVVLHPVEFLALSFVITEAEKRIKEIIQSKQ